MPPLIFWDVDTQHDFMRSDGLLYVPGSEAIIPLLRSLTNFAHEHGVPIVASADDHIAGHRELSDSPDFQRTFPPHCMRGTPGQLKIVETRLLSPLVIEPEPEEPDALTRRVAAHRGDILLHKHWFDVFTNANVMTVLGALDPQVIVLYGVALDVCDKYAVEGLLERRPETKLFLVKDAVRAIDPRQAEALLADWLARGVAMIDVDDVLAEELSPTSK